MNVHASVKMIPATVDVTARWALSGNVAVTWRTTEDTEVSTLSLAFAEVLRKSHGYARNRLSFMWQLPGLAATRWSETQRKEALASFEVGIMVHEETSWDQNCFCCEQPCHDAEKCPDAAPRHYLENCYRCLPTNLCGDCRVRLPRGWCCYECLEPVDVKHASSADWTRMTAVRSDMIEYLEGRALTHEERGMPEYW